jgi:hypothetical protein
VLESYTGIYEIAKGEYREVIREGNQLYTQRTGGDKYPVYPESESTFYYTLSLSRLTFIKGPDGKVVKMIMHRPEGDEDARRVEKREEFLADSPLGELHGEYGEKDGFKIKVFASGDKLMAQGTGQPAIEITPEGKDIYKNQEMGIRLEFQRDKNEMITGFYLFQNGFKIIMDKN